MPNIIHHAIDVPWEALISQLETTLRVGIHAHEAAPQRLWVDARISGFYPAYPTDISQCIDYAMLHHLVTVEWPKRPHVPLLETLVMELLEHIFHHAASATEASVGIYKPDIFREAEKVGVRLTLTRADFLKIRAERP